MAFKEYPKMIYLGDKGVIVNNKEEETKLEKKDSKEDKKSGWGK